LSGRAASRNKRLRKLQKQGFALVVSLSLMMLVVVLALSLLTLSTRSLASTGRQAEKAEAKANARMALALAIGQLQKHTGPDQRVTTAADQISSGGDGSDSSAAEGRRHWTGVYRSWPDTVDRRPNPEFLSWLVSGEPDDATTRSTAENLGGRDGDIELVGEGTLGDASEGRVTVAPLRTVSAAGGEARIGWWTGDQGIKAAVSTPAPTLNSGFADLRGAAQGAPRNAVELAEGATERPFQGLDPADPRLALVSDWQQTGFLASDIHSPRELFHDLAPTSTGLLTNVRAGGFRKDLSMQLERPSSTAPRTPLYTVSGEPGINLQELWCYYNLYKEVRTSGGTTFTTGGRITGNTPFLQVEASAAACQTDDEFHLKQPIIISYQMVLSFETRTTTVNGAAMNRLHVVADPVLTFWNPLDVPVVVPRSTFFSVKYWQIPYDLYIGVNGGAMRRFPLAASLSNAKTDSNGDANYLSLRVGELQPMVFKPGEVIKMSQSGATLVKGANEADHKLAGKSGFNYGGGVSVPVKDLAGGFIQMSASDVIRYEARPNNLTAGKTSSSGNTITGGNAHTRHFSLTHHEYYIGEDRGSNSLGVGGMYIDWDFGNRRVRSSEVRSETQPGTKPSGSRLYAMRFPDVFRTIKDQDTRPLTGAELNGRKAPFMLLSYNAKTEAGSETGTRFLSRFNPRALHVDFYDLTAGERDILPYEFNVEPLDSWRNRSLEVSTNGNAYFGGSMNAEFGNSFVSTHSVPREPIVSLAAFQHSTANGFEFNKPKYGYATLNGREPMLPQISHAIGNSMAPPMMSPDRTEGSLPGGRPMADHSYLANRALWDDWFLSGISPQTVAAFTKRRAQRDVALQFLDGSGKLPVVRYMPDTGGAEPGDLISKFFTGSTPSNTAITDVASLIRVDGLFNVNSTSVEAWKAMLGSLKGRQIVVRDESGAESIATDEETPVANLRSPHSMVADGNGNLDVKDPAQWVGRRSLSEGEITALAEAIVREVRMRGPFLSLSDFVNRRPGSDKELARAGTIQSALDSREVAINSAFNGSGRSVGSGVASRFAFSEAEEGPAAFGCPGVVKQADILTPIAPVLSARSDSFIIRAYGESVDPEGKVLARAWCEATVERDREFIDSSDAPPTLLTELDAEVNKSFGRRYQITSFRWLHPEEI
jgi:Tfp pilus assembly protein PilX